MLEELKEEKLIEKVGGRFKLSALIQKRLVYLNKGARSFVDSDKKDKLQIVLQEIMEDKIYLDMDGNLATNTPEGTDVSTIDFSYANPGGFPEMGATVAVDPFSNPGM